MDICPNIFANDTGTGTVNPSAPPFDPFFTYTFQCIANYLLTAIKRSFGQLFLRSIWSLEYDVYTMQSGIRQTIILDQTTDSYLLLRLATLFRYSLLDKRHSHWSHIDEHTQSTDSRLDCNLHLRSWLHANWSRIRQSAARTEPGLLQKPFCSCKQQFICLLTTASV